MVRMGQLATNFKYFNKLSSHLYDTKAFLIIPCLPMFMVKLGQKVVLFDVAVTTINEKVSTLP